MFNRVVRQVLRALFVATAAASLTTGTSAAQDPPTTASELPDTPRHDDTPIRRALANTDPSIFTRFPGADDATNTDRSRPGALMPLYTSLAVVQGLDIHSTRRGVTAGRREVNPVVEPLVKNGAAHIVVKVAATATVVIASEKLWRGKKKRAAIVLVAATNAGLAAIVAKNYRAAR